MSTTDPAPDNTAGECASQGQPFISYVPGGETGGMTNGMFDEVVLAQVLLIGTVTGEDVSPLCVGAGEGQGLIVFTGRADVPPELTDEEAALVLAWAGGERWAPDNLMAVVFFGAHALDAIARKGADVAILTPVGMKVLTARRVIEVEPQIWDAVAYGGKATNACRDWLLEDVKGYPDVADALGIEWGDDSLTKYAKYVLSGPGIPDLEDPEGQPWDRTARGGRGGPGAPNPSFLEVQRRYRMLGWPDKGYADVISSWTTTAKAALQLAAADLGLDYKVPNKKQLVAAIKDRDPAFLAFWTTLEDSEHSGIARQVAELASRCHTIANFMPCPDGYFNSDKGTFPWSRNFNGPVNWDYLNLMVDGIEAEYERLRLAEKLETKLGIKIRKHRDFLLANRETYRLEDWYRVTEDGRLEGIPTFEGQSHAHPVPSTLEEARQCLSEMTFRTWRRAQRIAARFTMTPGE